MEMDAGSSVLPRAAAGALTAALEVSPVVVLMGARQTGKTTLARSHPALASHAYVSLDDLDVRLQAREEPDALVERAPTMILDEAQRAPDVLIAVKRAVDRDPRRTPGRFVLTGSANLLMLSRLGETLAGRAVFVRLWPFARRERLGLGRTGPWSEILGAPVDAWPEVIAAHAGPQEDWRVAVKLGGFPVPSLRLADDAARAIWLAGYVQTYVERDLPEIRAVENLADFRRLLRAAALRTGGLLNQTEVARDLGTSQAQVHRFLGVLEVSCLVVRLGAFSVNRTKRLIKAPKLYWCDPALALHLAELPAPAGVHLENLVLLDLLAWRDAAWEHREVLYWRTASGHEVDFVVEVGDRLLPIEVKAAERVVPADARGLAAFLDEYPDLADGGLLLYGGSETFRLTARVLAVPWWAVC
jgi:predicted AAA+ superfamily ATPase